MPAYSTASLVEGLEQFKDIDEQNKETDICELKQHTQKSHMVCYLNVRWLLAVQSIFTVRPSVSEFFSSLGLVTSAGHAASSYTYMLSTKYLTPTKVNTASSPSALTSLSLCSLTRRHTHSETEEGTNTPASASTPKHAHTALISANCWRWVLWSFKGKQTGIEWGSRWEEEGERALRARQMQALRRREGVWMTASTEKVLKVSSTPPQIVKMEATWIEAFYEPERKNTATAASVGDVWVISSSGWSQRNLLSVWRSVASCLFFVRRNKGFNLRNCRSSRVCSWFSV